MFNAKINGNKVICISNTLRKEEEDALVKMGFDMSTIESTTSGVCRTIVCPREHITTTSSVSVPTMTIVRYNGVEVITMTHRNTLIDPSFNMNIDMQAVEEALITQEPPRVLPIQKEVIAVRDDLPPKKIVNFEEQFQNTLYSLDYMVNHEGAHRGYWKYLKDTLSKIEILEKYDKKSFDSAMESNPKYKELRTKFPQWKWTPEYQAKLEGRDNGINIGTFIDKDKGTNQCSIM
jgi:hypothetical protein